MYKKKCITYLKNKTAIFKIFDLVYCFCEYPSKSCDIPERVVNRTFKKLNRVESFG